MVESNASPIPVADLEGSHLYPNIFFNSMKFLGKFAKLYIAPLPAEGWVGPPHTGNPGSAQEFL